jgi:hypothetical protein
MTETTEDVAGCRRCGAQLADADVHQRWHKSLQKQMKKTSRQQTKKRERQLDRRLEADETAKAAE